MASSTGVVDMVDMRLEVTKRRIGSIAIQFGRPHDRALKQSLS